MERKKENRSFLTKQIITYIGNKRSLISEICTEFDKIRAKIKKDKLVSLDLFSGSGIVSRALKQYSSKLIANDLESYSKVINECFLSNKNEIDYELFDEYLKKIETLIKNEKVEGIISTEYAPKDDSNIKPDERAFYTRANALYIDSFRKYIDEVVPQDYKKFFLALLITEASIHVNTSGVFKGFYKDKSTGIGKFGGTDANALSRIKSPITIKRPILSSFDCEYLIMQEDAVELAKNIGHVDVAYLDPPYNQHPYGSNYFMLNLILSNEPPAETSKVSGIPKDWNHSPFNRKSEALKSLEEIISAIDASFIIISYNNEGFVSFDEMNEMLNKYGEVDYKRIEYNTFRGGRNLRERNIHTSEFLFVLDKRK